MFYGLRKENKSMKTIQIYKLDDSSRVRLCDEILTLMTSKLALPMQDNLLLIEYIPLGITIRVRFDIFKNHPSPNYLSIESRVLTVQSTDLHFSAVFRDFDMLSPERVLILLEFLMDPYSGDENKRELICEVIHELTKTRDLSRWIYNMNESREKQVNGDEYIISVIKMFNEAGEYQLLAKVIQNVLHYDDKATLKIMIENVDPDPIIEWFTEYDVEKSPLVINLFNEYGKYQSLEL